MFIHSLVRRLLVLVFSVAALGGWALTSAAAEPVKNPPQDAAFPAVVTHALSREDAEAWLDGLMPAELKTAQVPGAVVVVVKGTEVLLAKGYGYSNYEKGTPVDPKSTLFRPGSTSKLFTWTAVMQLVEQGKLDLDADINTYLDFKIPPLAGKPVTLRQTMTHTAGFEERGKDLINFDDKSPSLERAVKENVPPRIFGAGTTPAYSNYATALAGYVVQRVSGQLFEDYVEQHIFTPLGMRNSTFRQPLPDAMKPHMSVGYITTDKPGKGFEIVTVPPAGALSATGEDMAQFMIAHLNQGVRGASRILLPETVRLMHTSITRALPDLNGMALGFYQHNVNGHTAIAHAGDTLYFHSDMVLFTDDAVGVFISVNGTGKNGLGGAIRSRLFNGFADRYFPGADTTTTARVDSATAKSHAAAIAGSYVGSRRADSSFMSLVSLLSPVKVVANSDGSITLPAGGEPRTFFETAPYLWSEQNGHDRLQAIVRDGRVERWSLDSLAFAFVFERPAGLAGAGLQMPLMLAALAALVVCALSWPAAALARRVHRVPAREAGRRTTSRRLMNAAAWLSLIGLGLWAQSFVLLRDNVGGIGAWILLAQITSLIGFVGGLLVSLWYAAAVFAGPKGSAARLFAVLLVASFAFMSWSAIGYHLIGLSSQY